MINNTNGTKSDITIMTIIRKKTSTNAIAFISILDRLQEKATEKSFIWGYIQQVTPIQQFAKERDLRLWNSLRGTSSYRGLMRNKAKRR